MPPNYHEAAFQRRALLGLLPDGDDSTTASSTGTAATTAAAAEETTTGGGGLLGGLTSAVGGAVGGVTSALGNLGPSTSSSSASPSTTSIPRASSTISSTSSSSTSTSVSTSSSVTTSSTTSATPSSVSTSAPSTTSAVPSAPEAVSQSEATTTYLSTSDNQVITVTATRQVSAIATSAAESETASVPGGGSQEGFLQNKPLSGTIFAFVGLIGLAIIILLATWFLRRSRRNRLEREAEQFPSNFWPNTDSNEKRNVELTRSPSDRSNAGSDQALIGGSNGVGYGYGAADRMNDGTIRQDVPAPPPQMHPSTQTQQGAYGMGMGGGMNMNMNMGGAFNPLPAPPARSSPPPQMPMQSYGGGYESPYAAYQQAAHMPPQIQQPNPQRTSSNGSGWSGGGSSPVTHQGPPSIFGQGNGRDSLSSAPGSGLGNGGQQQGRNGVRASAGSDAYADYAYATGPGQQNSREPRNLTIANA